MLSNLAQGRLIPDYGTTDTVVDCDFSRTRQSWCAVQTAKTVAADRALRHSTHNKLLKVAKELQSLGLI